MIVRAGWVLPISSPPIRDGFVEFEGPRLTGVGPASELPESLRSAGEAGAHLTDGVLLPGFVNPHAHLELTCYEGKLRPAPFWPWVQQLVPLRRQPEQVRRERAAAADGARRCLRTGITCVGDISRRNIAWEALKPSPIRKVCFVELLALADERPRNPAELREEISRVEEDERLTVGVTPHAPYSVPIEQVRAAIELAAELGRPWTMHLGETVEEIGFLAGREDALPAMLRSLLAQCGLKSPACSLIEYLDRVTRGLPAGSLAHMNYAQPADFETLAGSGQTIIYCPRAHRFFGHPPHPFVALREAGVRTTIGTDSAASNEGLSMLAELRVLRGLAPSLPAGELLRIVTLDAAGALGMADRIGSLESGKLADLVVFSPGRAVAEPQSWLLDEAAEPAGVWVGGRRCVG
ncbi:MAG: amidohydrolase family protein [Planctomycetes bacterium]|nr:amidohydrolase family protein [Planctomycetota bacterium]